MVLSDGSHANITDTSAPPIGTGDTPSFSVTIVGSNCEIQVIDGSGFTFKSFSRKL